MRRVFAVAGRHIASCFDIRNARLTHGIHARIAWLARALYIAAMPPPTPPAVREAIYRAVLEDFANGLPLATACEKHHVCDGRMYAAMRDSVVWRDAWRAASERHAAALVRQALELAETDPDPARARNRISIRQWIAGRMARETWGDRVDVSVDQRVSIAAALEAADARLRPIRDLSRVIDAESADVSALPALTTTDNETAASAAAPGDALPDPFD